MLAERAESGPDGSQHAVRSTRIGSGPILVVLQDTLVVGLVFNRKAHHEKIPHRVGILGQKVRLPPDHAEGFDLFAVETRRLSASAGSTQEESACCR
jgi:hypothetical protein